MSNRNYILSPISKNNSQISQPSKFLTILIEILDENFEKWFSMFYSGATIFGQKKKGNFWIIFRTKNSNLKIQTIEKIKFQK